MTGKPGRPGQSTLSGPAARCEKNVPLPLDKMYNAVYSIVQRGVST